MYKPGMGEQGGMVPWAMLQQYRDLEFLQLSGARIVRIAVHPDLPKLGYGSRALSLLRAYYQVDPPPVCQTARTRCVRGAWDRCTVCMRGVQVVVCDDK